MSVNHNVEVVFSRDCEADTFIILEAEWWRERHAPAIKVVTNDRRIQNSCFDLQRNLFAVEVKYLLDAMCNLQPGTPGRSSPTPSADVEQELKDFYGASASASHIDTPSDSEGHAIDFSCFQADSDSQDEECNLSSVSFDDLLSVNWDTSIKDALD